MTLTTAPPQAEPRSLYDRLPSVAHNNQLGDPDIQRTAREIVAP